jgi:hypothetical protein
MSIRKMGSVLNAVYILFIFLYTFDGFEFNFKFLLKQPYNRPQTSRSHYGSKVPAVTVTVFKYRNKIGKIVVKAVPYSVT